MKNNLPPKLNSEILKQLATEKLVEMIVEQARAIEQLKSRVIELEQEIEKLKISRDLDSTTSSKPPSSDLLKKSEKKLEAQIEFRETPKRKPGGQPGHPGKTRKGFGRVDRFEILRPQVCRCCGQGEFSGEPIKIDTQQGAAVSRESNRNSRISKIYVYLQRVWGNTNSRLVARNSTGTRYRNQTASFFGMDK